MASATSRCLRLRLLTGTVSTLVCFAVVHVDLNVCPQLRRQSADHPLHPFKEAHNAHVVQ